MNLKHYSIIVLALLAVSCANRGIGPQGGPKDSIPPVALRSEPELGALDFHGKRIEIAFSEYLQLNDLASNLLMSPPQQTPPDVKARGKKILVQFQDTLRDSTTYTIDFGDAICDYTEKNPVHGFTFYFSTGSEIDTLEYVGRVFDAQTLNPLKGIMVGIHDNLADSAFTTQSFLRIARTDSAGLFRIGNIHPGIYRLYAVDDVSRDYRLTLGEAIAFADSLIRVYPSSDTLTLAADSLYPELFLFKEQRQRLYLQRTLREQAHRIQLLFSSSPDSIPALRAMRPSESDSTRSDSAWIDPMPYLYAHYTPHRDTLTLWLTDSIAIAQDTIVLEARYRRTDSLYRLEWYTDTLRAVWRAPKLNARAREAQERANRNRRLELKTNARKGFEIYDTLRLTCSTPLASIELDSIRIVERVDTTFQPVPFTIAPHDSLPMRLSFIASLKPDGQYELQMDSGALHDIYGVTHVAARYALRVKTEEDYSTLRVRLTPFDKRAQIELLSAKDQVVRTLPAETDGALFRFLKPDTYYLRMYIDMNGDGQWTTGSWDEQRQPEPVYYFPDKIQTKSNWDFEEEWDYTAHPRTASKPIELIKASNSKKK